jgi:hypothetical protein
VALALFKYETFFVREPDCVCPRFQNSQNTFHLHIYLISDIESDLTPAPITTNQTNLFCLVPPCCLGSNVFIFPLTSKYHRLKYKVKLDLYDTSLKGFSKQSCVIKEWQMEMLEFLNCSWVNNV